MKEEIMRRAIGDIDDTLIEGAEKEEKKMKKNTTWIKWTAVAAALAVLTAAAVLTLPLMFKNVTPAESPDTPTVNGIEGGDNTREAVFEKGYTYSVDEGKYALYVKGKVINEKYIGGKLEDVTVTAGWMDANKKMLTEEHAKAEIYEITGVSTDTAVAIRFLDKLEAQTTDHYYVIMNPDADLTPVQSYVITYDAPGQNEGAEIFE